MIVEMTGRSYPAIRAAIDLYEAGGWSAIRPAQEGRARGDGRVLRQAKEGPIRRMIVDTRPEQLESALNNASVRRPVAFD